MKRNPVVVVVVVVTVTSFKKLFPPKPAEGFVAAERGRGGVSCLPAFRSGPGGCGTRAGGGGTAKVRWLLCCSPEHSFLPCSHRPRVPELQKVAACAAPRPGSSPFGLETRIDGAFMIGLGGTQGWLFLDDLFYFYCISRRTGNGVPGAVSGTENLYLTYLGEMEGCSLPPLCPQSAFPTRVLLGLRS